MCLVINWAKYRPATPLPLLLFLMYQQVCYLQILYQIVVVCFCFSSELFQILLANYLVRENKKFSSSLGKVKKTMGERRDLEDNF